MFSCEMKAKSSNGIEGHKSEWRRKVSSRNPEQLRTATCENIEAQI